ncbi:type II toxin-antitoxin system VapC family toxin [Desulfobacca acetoxidans]|uniref:PilT domain-containing protein n=1 Tax=Desulfobacca acetoxidans (strain ATCC 700848 / DSM 11109 / ASRB2) TaxID=880072 RepID=F2NEX3_DESAR|nr:twitching motility protein PilT [Desulfobacca acetoxidans]AEB08313.1 PilT domain-containing protein [Desulfobacca acetoxidans DSM 11109]
MMVFADTSALFALLVHDDDMHGRAKANFEYFMANHTQLLTSSYVLLETLTLLQRRVSLESVWDFNHKIMPLLEVVWADAGWHSRAVQRLQVEKKRSVSLTDCLSFEIMEAWGGPYGLHL